MCAGVHERMAKVNDKQFSREHKQQTIGNRSSDFGSDTSYPISETRQRRNVLSERRSSIWSDSNINGRAIFTKRPFYLKVVAHEWELLLTYCCMVLLALMM
ncbi:hypothetical protein CBL_08907 [Carabus blaptoides fortunei]